MKGNIIIIETSDVGARYTADAVKVLGYEPIFICSLQNYQADTRSQILQYKWFEAETTNLQSVLEVISKNNIENIAAITTFLDSRLSIACQLAKTLKVPGVDDAILSLCDKGEVAQLIPEYSPTFEIFNVNTIPHEWLRSMLNDVGKIVIKPTQSAGAFGMFTISKISEIDNLAALMAAENSSKLMKGDWIAQPMLAGQLISLEGFVHQSQVKFLGFSTRRKIENTETVNIFPSDEQFSLNQRVKAYQAIKQLVNRSNFQNGYFHTEFIVTEDNCYLIDANFGRIAGGGIAQQIAIAYEATPVELFCHILWLTLFSNNSLSKKIFEKSPPRKTLSINYGIRQESILQEVSVPKSASHQFIHTLLLDQGTNTPAMGKNNWSWVGIAVGLPDTLLSYIDNIKIRSNHGEETPFYLEPGSLDINALLSSLAKPLSDCSFIKKKKTDKITTEDIQIERPLFTNIQ